MRATGPIALSTLAVAAAVFPLGSGAAPWPADVPIDLPVAIERPAGGPGLAALLPRILAIAAPIDVSYRWAYPPAEHGVGTLPAPPVDASYRWVHPPEWLPG